MMLFCGFMVDNLLSLVFLRTIYNFLLDGNLSRWNSIYNVFPISLKIHIYTQRVFLSYPPPVFQLCISFGFRGSLECKTVSSVSLIGMLRLQGEEL